MGFGYTVPLKQHVPPMSVYDLKFGVPCYAFVLHSFLHEVNQLVEVPGLPDHLGRHQLPEVELKEIFQNCGTFVIKYTKLVIYLSHSCIAVASEAIPDSIGVNGYDLIWTEPSASDSEP